MSAVRPIRRIPWFDNLLSTQISFALGALCVFVPMFPALVSLETRARNAERLHQATVQRDANELVQALNDNRPTSPVE